MATTEQATSSQSSLQELARRHLWLHFARMGGYDDAHEVYNTWCSRAYAQDFLLYKLYTHAAAFGHRH